MTESRSVTAVIVPQLLDSVSQNWAAKSSSPPIKEYFLKIIVEDGENQVTGETEYKLAQTIAAFLGKHMES